MVFTTETRLTPKRLTLKSNRNRLLGKQRIKESLRRIPIFADSIADHRRVFHILFVSIKKVAKVCIPSRYWVAAESPDFGFQHLRLNSGEPGYDPKATNLRQMDLTSIVGAFRLGIDTVADFVTPFCDLVIQPLPNRQSKRNMQKRHREPQPW